MRSKLAVLLLTVLAVAGCGSGHPVSPSATGSIHPPGWGKPAPPTALARSIFPSASTATMYDSVTLSTVPAFPFAQAGYTAGHWITFGPMRAAWPNAHTVSIAISVRYHADCLDVEPGDATPGEAVAWIRVEMRLGWSRPCVYSDWWEYTHEIDPLLAQAHIHSWQVWKWDADYTHVAHIDPGFDATQWTSTCLGRNLDCSLVLRAFLTIAHPPLLPPKPKPSVLNTLIRERERTRRHLIHAGCRVHRPRRACTPLFHHGNVVKARIRVLEAEGVR
jgi:hypothetical protein